MYILSQIINFLLNVLLIFIFFYCAKSAITAHEILEDVKMSGETF